MNHFVYYMKCKREKKVKSETFWKDVFCAANSAESKDIWVIQKRENCYNWITTNNDII